MMELKRPVKIYTIDDGTEFGRKQRRRIIDRVISDKTEAVRQNCHEETEPSLKFDR